MRLPDAVVRRLTLVAGDDAWNTELPARIERLRERRSIAIGPALEIAAGRGYARLLDAAEDDRRHAGVHGATVRGMDCGARLGLAGSLAVLAGCVTISERRIERCEGVAFAAHCGNGTCDEDESALSCPADCANAKVVSYNLQTICDGVHEVLTPTSTAEVQAAVARARREGLPIRVIGRRHSSNGQLCNDGLIVSTAELDQALYIERFDGVETVVTQPGIRYGDLTRWLDERGRSLGFAVLGTRDPTIAGAIATASHGSSPRHPSVISSRVESMQIVDAEGELHEYRRRTTDETTWKALTAGLGLTGIVTELRLRIEPTFNLDVQVSYHDDAGLGRGNGPIDYVRDCDYGQLLWFPGRRRVVRMCGVKTDLPREPGATNRLLKPDFRKWVAGPAERGLHYGTCNAHFNCATLERVRYRQLVREPPLYRKMAPGQPDRSLHQVVGAGYAMMSSELTLAQQGILQHDFEFAVPAGEAAATFAAARRLFTAERICLPLVGVFIRFSRIEDEAWIAHTSTSDRFVEGQYVTFFEMPLYVPEGIDQATRDELMAPYEGWIRTLIDERRARPHWGKNDDWVFELQDAEAAYGARWASFRAVVERLDPDGVFSNAWAEARGFRGAR